MAFDVNVSEAAVKASGSRGHYRPELDWLRFIAFLAVFLHHSLPVEVDYYSAWIGDRAAEWVVGAVQAGGFGVDLFFALSSYLITDILLREARSCGRIHILEFYARRALRIWPLYFLFLALAWALPFLNQGYSHSGLAPFLFYLFFAGNWYCVIWGYPPTVAAPLWSVSIEEQFYLAWPILLRATGVQRLPVTLALLLAVSFATRLYYCAVGASHPAIWCNTLARFDPIVAGALLSIFGGRWCLPWGALGRWLLLMVGVFGLTVCGLYNTVIGCRAMLGYPVVALCCVCILRCFVGLNLSWPGLRAVAYLGKISYGLYVFHVLAIKLVHDHLPGVASEVVIGLALTVVMAAASYQFIEMPFLKFKARFTRVESRSA